jgi:cation transport regulator ChaB
MEVIIMLLKNIKTRKSGAALEEVARKVAWAAVKKRIPEE